MAPMELLGRYMLDWFDFSIADEVHQLAGDTAQGNGLAALARIAKKVITLTGTMMGGYADDLYNVLYRIDAPQMVREGFEWGGAGRNVPAQVWRDRDRGKNHRERERLLSQSQEARFRFCAVQGARRCCLAII